MEKVEKNINKVKDSELERLKKNKKEVEEKIQQLINEGYSWDEAVEMTDGEDSKELIEREGIIEGEEDRARKRRKNEAKKEN